MNIHFIYKKGKNKNSIPLLISHGWPGSFLEFYEIIDPLTDPKSFGLDNEISFELIIPSIPGFAFSDKPPAPFGPRKIASYYNDLMTKVLNYKSYMAQGGDWGGAISSWLGYDHKILQSYTSKYYDNEKQNWPQTEEENLAKGI